METSRPVVLDLTRCQRHPANMTRVTRLRHANTTDGRRREGGPQTRLSDSPSTTVWAISGSKKSTRNNDTAAHACLDLVFKNRFGRSREERRQRERDRERERERERGELVVGRREFESVRARVCVCASLSQLHARVCVCA